MLASTNGSSLRYTGSFLGDASDSAPSGAPPRDRMAEAADPYYAHVYERIIGGLAGVRADQYLSKGGKVTNGFLG
jgi:hypothetical protein